ncbi:MAG: hypothetical protein RR543_00300 [Erysipelotrichales bacterium]
MKKLLSLILPLFLIVACGSGKYNANKLMNYTDINEMFNTPKKYNGKSLQISGKIFEEPKVDKDQVTLKVWRDFEGANQLFIVKGTTKDVLAKDDYIKLEGVVSGELKDKNKVGGEILLPQIDAVKIEKATYIDAVAPTIKEYEVNKTITQHKISQTIEKIEFAEKETRVYFKIVNNSKEKFNFYTYHTKAIIDGKPYGVVDNIYNEYEKINSELLPNATTTGVVVLNPIQDYDGKNIRITTEGYSYDYNLHFKANTFNIILK